MSGLPLITCPACQTEMGLEALLGTDDARAVVEIMARCPGSPSLRKAMLRYAGLFAPASQKLRWGRVEKLLVELVTMMESGRIERGGRVWPAPLDYWQSALDAVLANATLRRPLKSHGYLLEVLAGMANTAEAQAEKASDSARAGHTPIGHHPSHTAPSEREAPRSRTAMPQGIKDQLKQFTQKGAN